MLDHERDRKLAVHRGKLDFSSQHCSQIFIEIFSVIAIFLFSYLRGVGDQILQDVRIFKGTQKLKTVIGCRHSSVVLSTTPIYAFPFVVKFVVFLFL